MMGLTPQQAACLRFIHGYQRAHNGISPSLEEIGAGMGRSKAGVHRLLTMLESRRAIKRLYGRWRAIKITAPVAVPTIKGMPLYFVPIGEAGR
jgi:SOS-response transcriptional repressor LexA